MIKNKKIKDIFLQFSSRPQLIEQSLFLFQIKNFAVPPQGLKASVALVLLVGVIPLLFGFLLEVVVLMPVRVPLHQVGLDGQDTPIILKKYLPYPGDYPFELQQLPPPCGRKNDFFLQTCKNLNFFTKFRLKDSCPPPPIFANKTSKICKNFLLPPWACMIPNHLPEWLHNSFCLFFYTNLQKYTKNRPKDSCPQFLLIQLAKSAKTFSPPMGNDSIIFQNDSTILFVFQSPVYFPWQDWALGAMYTKISIALTFMGPDWWMKTAIERLYQVRKLAFDKLC